MKIKALVLALFALGIAAALAVSAPASPGKGKPTTGASTGETTGTSATTTSKSKGKAKGADRAAACKPHKAIVLKGTYVAPGAGGFAMDVTSGNKAAKGFVGKQATVLVDEKTRVTRHGKAAAADLKAGDKLVVEGRACKADAATGAVLAQRVSAKPAKADDEKKPRTPTAPRIGTTTETTTG